MSSTGEDSSEDTSSEHTSSRYTPSDYTSSEDEDELEIVQLFQGDQQQGIRRSSRNKTSAQKGQEPKASRSLKKRRHNSTRKMISRAQAKPQKQAAQKKNPPPPREQAPVHDLLLQEQAAQKEQQPEKKKSSKVMKNGKYRRSVTSPPTSLSSVKDRTVRTKFEVCAKHISELQYCNTFEEKAPRDYHPKSQHFMFTYDELVQKPHYVKNGIAIRPSPLGIFLAPKGVSQKSFAATLQKISKEMAKNSGKGYVFATSTEEYSELVFGHINTKSKNDKNEE